MKTTALKEEAETLNGKLRELTEEALEQVTGGLSRRNIRNPLAGCLDRTIHYY